MTTPAYYEIPESAWIFRAAPAARPSTDAQWSPSEESARQWCLQDLIRSYGVRIDCLEVEHLAEEARGGQDVKVSAQNAVGTYCLHKGTPTIVLARSDIL